MQSLTPKDSALSDLSCSSPMPPRCSYEVLASGLLKWLMFLREDFSALPSRKLYDRWRARRTADRKSGFVVFGAEEHPKGTGSLPRRTHGCGGHGNLGRACAATAQGAQLARLSMLEETPGTINDRVQDSRRDPSRDSRAPRAEFGLVL